MNQPITIQVRSDSKAGGMGGQVDTWDTVRADFAHVEDKTFREAADGGRIISMQGKRFTIRRDNTLTSEDNGVLYDSVQYNIRAIRVDDRNVRSPYTIIEGIEGAAI